MLKKSILTVIVLLFISSTAMGQSISLKSVDGLTSDGKLPSDGGLVTFFINMTGDDDFHRGITNGFRIYSPDGANWTTTMPDTIYDGLSSMFDLIFAVNEFSIDGALADTVGFGGARLHKDGMPPGFDEVCYSITIGPISTTSAGKTIVLDSCYYPPAGYWKWGAVDVFPAWDGPHSFSISESKLKGDFNDDGSINIADLVAFVGYYFNGGEPPDFMESIDMNDDGIIDILDLQIFVDMYFH